MGTEYSLQDEGMLVTWADCFRKVQELFKTENDSFDCVLLDVMLPDSDGYHICEWIKKQNESLPVIFLTALSDEGNIVHGLNIGGDDYLTKPFRTKELKSIGGIENTGLYLAREHHIFYDSKIKQQGIDFCAEIGYDQKHMEQLKDVVIERFILYFRF